MKFEYALEHVRKGEKVKRKGWKNKYVAIDGRFSDKPILIQYNAEETPTVKDNIPIADVMADDWRVGKNQKDYTLYVDSDKNLFIDGEFVCNLFVNKTGGMIEFRVSKHEYAPLMCNIEMNFSIPQSQCWIE